MHIKSVCVNNFGSHQETKLSFKPTGVNIILGSNGSGKSQLVGAILFALLGYHSKVKINRPLLKNQSSVVKMILEDGRNIEELECLVSDFPNVAIPVKRVISYPPTNGVHTPLHKQALDNINVPNAPKLTLETYERDSDVVLPEFLNLKAITDVINKSPELNQSWLNILDFLESTKGGVPDYYSIGFRAFLKVLEEFSRRAVSTENIPLIIDGGFDYFDFSSVKIAVKLLEHIAQTTQVIFLSKDPELIKLFSKETTSSYSKLVFDSKKSMLSAVNYDWGLDKTLDVEISSKVNIPRVVTEGKTDWKHLKAALGALQEQGKFKQLQLELSEKEDSMGSRELVKYCNAISQFKNPRKIICVFDRDEPDLVQKVTEGKSDYRNWGNNVFSIALPIPQHRQSQQDLCVEMYYSDEDLFRTDNNGRRLYISSEFSAKSGRHLKNDKIKYAHAGKLKEDKTAIIDNDVFDNQDKNIALPKDDFAECILQQSKGFQNINFSGFEKLFYILSSISRV